MNIGSPQYLRVEDVAKRLSVSPKTIREWINRRILSAYRPTRRTILIREDYIEKALERFRVGDHLR